MKTRKKSLYVERMRAIRGGGKSDVASRSTKKSNPLPVRKTYRKRKAIQKDLTRYYEDCTVSKSARRFKSKRRRKSYCAGVAWKRAKKKHPDYTGEKSMARKSRRKSAVARRRPRNTKGHFVKKKSRAREASAAPRRRRRAVRRKVAEVAETPRPRRRYRRTNPWHGQPRRHARAARLGHTRRRRRRHAARRRRHAAVRTAPRRRTVRRTVRRTARRTARRTVRRTRSAASYRRAARKGAETRARRRMIGPLPPGEHRPSGPEHQQVGEYALENPLSGGELAFVVATAAGGWVAADFLGRWLNTTAVATPGASAPVNGVPIGALTANDVANLIMPGWQSMAGQGALAVVSGIAAHMSDHPMAKASLQGFMIGTGLHLFADVAKPLIAGLLRNTAFGQQLYLAEIEAREAGALTAVGTTVTASGTGTLAQGTTAVLGSAAAGVTSGTTLAGLPRRDVGPVARGLAMNLMHPAQPAQPAQQAAQGLRNMQNLAHQNLAAMYAAQAPLQMLQPVAGQAPLQMLQPVAGPPAQAPIQNIAALYAQGPGQQMPPAQAPIQNIAAPPAQQMAQAPCAPCTVAPDQLAQAFKNAAQAYNNEAREGDCGCGLGLLPQGVMFPEDK